MTTATGIYWCLVLTGCMSLVSGKFMLLVYNCYANTNIAVVLFHQTVPDAGVVPCTGDRVELECITDTGTVIWKHDDGVTQLSEISETGNRGSFFFTVTADDGNMITSRATITSVNTSLNGSSIGCSGVFQLDSFIYLTINVTG